MKKIIKILYSTDVQHILEQDVNSEFVKSGYQADASYMTNHLLLVVRSLQLATFPAPKFFITVLLVFGAFFGVANF